jgi:hypothetical protein
MKKISCIENLKNYYDFLKKINYFGQFFLHIRQLFWDRGISIFILNLC